MLSRWEREEEWQPTRCVECPCKKEEEEHRCKKEGEHGWNMEQYVFPAGVGLGRPAESIFESWQGGGGGGEIGLGLGWFWAAEEVQLPAVWVNLGLQAENLSTDVRLQQGAKLSWFLAARFPTKQTTYFLWNLAWWHPTPTHPSKNIQQIKSPYRERVK